MPLQDSLLIDGLHLEVCYLCDPLDQGPEEISSKKHI